MRTPRQSTLGALAVTQTRLSAMSELHRFTGVEGRRWRDAIALIDGQHSGEIANALVRTGDRGCTSESEALIGSRVPPGARVG